MKRREDIVQKFSTFLNFTTANSITSAFWQVDVELERHMKMIRGSDPEAKEEFWARHFLKISLQASQLENKSLGGDFSAKNNESEISVHNLKAKRHLSAYLQESCLWAAYKAYQRFNFIRYKYPLEECFQIACLAVNPPSKFLKNFNSSYQSSINSYARIGILRFVQNTICSQNIEARGRKYSDYGLLKDLTRIELHTALLSQGITQVKADLYCLVWKCFDEIYSPNQCQGNRSLKSPNQEHIRQICSCCSLRLEQLNIPVTSVSEEEIKQILLICVQAARKYGSKHFLPLDNYEDIWDRQTNLDNIIQEEAWSEVLSIVSQLLLAMPELGQIIIKLYKGLNLTQTEVASVLKDKYLDLQKQYQVARKLANYNRDFLKDFLNRWQQVHPELHMNNEKDIEKIKEALDECLQLHCKQLLNSCLESVLKELIKENRIINDFFYEGINKQKQKLNMSLEIKQQIIEGFNQRLEIDMCLPSKCLELIYPKMILFLDEWLRNKSFYVNN
jgi:hypothetical protein